MLSIRKCPAPLIKSKPWRLYLHHALGRSVVAIFSSQIEALEGANALICESSEPCS